ncbi:uncharacterized protein LOC123296387 [Chrysoperla carnea]|uniref:uncharacterized protein LOC123296387 n=1 Tax=Chrysoperla carnea TaxID=189513 RepID=UPI001D08A8F4|nr:uncharacterized protein LOC123296387 [Chrysoperla carnea]
MIDVNQILTILKERYQLLINNYIDLDSQQNLSAVALYQQALMDASNQAHHNDFDEVIDQTSLVSDIELNDPSIPSRDDIKKRSARIVQDCAKKDDDQPIILLPLRGKTY